MSILRFPAVTLVVALLAACNGGEEGDSPAQRYCSAVEIQQTTCGMASACDEAILSDCASVTSMLNDAYVDESASCVESGGGALECLVDSRAAVAPSSAHQAFATAFCDNCGLGIDGCQETLFDTENSELAVAGAIILPLGDSLVQKLQDECTSGFTCLATFSSCAQGVLAEEAIPTETLQCVLDGWISGTTEMSMCGMTSG
jgi:hypothetical protein